MVNNALPRLGRLSCPALRSRFADVSRFGGSVRCFFLFLGGDLKERNWYIIFCGVGWLSILLWVFVSRAGQFLTFQSGLYRAAARWLIAQKSRKKTFRLLRLDFLRLPFHCRGFAADGFAFGMLWIVGSSFFCRCHWRRFLPPFYPLCGHYVWFLDGYGLVLDCILWRFFGGGGVFNFTFFMNLFDQFLPLQKPLKSRWMKGLGGVAGKRA